MSLECQRCGHPAHAAGGCTARYYVSTGVSDPCLCEVATPTKPSTVPERCPQGHERWPDGCCRLHPARPEHVSHSAAPSPAEPSAVTQGPAPEPSKARRCVTCNEPEGGSVYCGDHKGPDTYIAHTFPEPSAVPQRCDHTEHSVPAPGFGIIVRRLGLRSDGEWEPCPERRLGIPSCTGLGARSALVRQEAWRAVLLGAVDVEPLAAGLVLGDRESAASAARRLVERLERAARGAWANRTGVGNLLAEAARALRAVGGSDV